jgi:hypothetical protein
VRRLPSSRLALGRRQRATRARRWCGVHQRGVLLAVVGMLPTAGMHLAGVLVQGVCSAGSQHAPVLLARRSHHHAPSTRGSFGRGQEPCSRRKLCIHGMACLQVGHGASCHGDTSKHTLGWGVPSPESEVTCRLRGGKACLAATGKCILDLSCTRESTQRTRPAAAPQVPGPEWWRVEARWRQGAVLRSGPV